MKKLTVEGILEFLTEFPGYKKEGANRLQFILSKKGFYVSIEDCAQGLREFNKGKVLTSTLILNKDLTPKKLKVLFYDIETSYNIVSSWRIGNKVSLSHGNIIKERAIICVSYKWLNEDEVYNMTWDSKQSDEDLIKEFIPVMNEADLIVAHNGEQFDLKWLKTRALKYGVEMLPSYPQVDTLQLARKHFYLNSNKLDYIAKFLGFEGKIKTEYELWDKIILEKNTEALNTMINYCNEDVVQLEKVYNKLASWEKPNYHLGVLNSKESYSSPVSGSSNLELVKTISTGAGTLRRVMRDLDTQRLFEIPETKYQKYLKNKLT